MSGIVFKIVYEKLLQSQQALYKVDVGFMYHTVLVEFAFAAIRLFSKNVTFEGFLMRDLASAGYFKSFFGAGVCFNLWHELNTFCGDTLLALPN